MEAPTTSKALVVLGVLCAVTAPFAYLLAPILVAIASVPLVIGLVALSRGERRLGLVLSALGLVVTLAGVALLVAIKPYEIPSESMAPALAPGDRALTTRFGGEDPHLGDIVVLHPPATATGDADGVDFTQCGARQPRGAACAKPAPGDAEASFVKRVVALGGDRVAIVDGRVQRNGVAQPEPYVQERCASGLAADFPTPIRIPEGHAFVLGDNRQCSEDSRFWGPVRLGAIRGTVILRHRPLRRFGRP